MTGLQTNKETFQSKRKTKMKFATMYLDRKFRSKEKIRTYEGMKKATKEPLASKIL